MTTDSLEPILESVAQVAPADLIAVLAPDAEDSLRVLTAIGRLATPRLRGLRIDLRHRPLLRAALERGVPTILHSKPGEELDEPDTYEEVVTLPGDHSCLVAPLRWEGDLLGLLTVDVAVCGAFQPVQVSAISALADLAVRLLVREREAADLARDLDLLAVRQAGGGQDGEETALAGSSTAWLEVLEKARLVAPTRATVLITGETGTGKEQVAMAIHRWSPRAGGPFIALNCSALVPDLASSELFGHERGAFTGADRRRDGRFALAERGTLFLDEVADLPPTAQAQLLRVIQERVFERVGGAGTLLKADVRLIAATHKDLRAEIEAGRFREDLYFRLNAYPIHVAPLRERRADIPALTAHLLRRIGKDLGFEGLRIGPAALRALERYAWPGNVRELRNALERAAILSRGGTIRAEDFDLTAAGDELEAPKRRTRTARVDARIPEELNRLDRAIAAEVLAALDESGGKVSGRDGAATKLSMPPTTLHSLMKRLKLHRRQPDASA